MPTAPDNHTIASPQLSAVITAKGAELVSLREADGAERLWQAGPDWPRHSPLLFPIVGRLAEDRLSHDGHDYRLTQHGFARDSRFDWVSRDEAGAQLRLSDSAATRALYPFGFTLDQAYGVAGTTLTVTTTVSNSGQTVLPFSIGAHPAFAWPLADGIPQTAHHLDFSDDETGEARTLTGGLLDGTVTLPLAGRRLPLTPELFAGDALIMPGLNSKSLRFVAQSEDGRPVRSLTIAWEGYRDLGLWSKPSGAAFLCIEPWSGMASPLGWQGEFATRPGVICLPPGERARFVWRVTLGS